MKSLVCVLLLQLGFSAYGTEVPEWLRKKLDREYQAVNLHFINKTDQPCILTNKMNNISFWSEDYEPHPITLDAGNRFDWLS